MRLGILADIHEAVEPLAAAVRELGARRVDAFVMLGDALESGERIDETVEILSALPGIAVWGNHDQGLCGEVRSSLANRYPARTLEYFARLRPWVDMEGYRFQHIDPHLDPRKFEDLWRFPTTEERIAGLGSCAHDRVVVGHMHRWGIFTPERQEEWDGDSTFRYRPGRRHLTVVNAVLHGWCAVLDTDRDALEPVRIS